MELDLRWKRVGRNGNESNTEKREKMDKARTSAKPVRLSATSNLHVPSSMPGKEKERDRGMGERAKKVDREKMDKAGTSGTVSVSHWVSCSFFDARTVISEREKEKERKRWVSNSSDQGTPHRKHNCLLHCQPMAIPASSPLNIKLKHNVHIRHFSIRPHRPVWVYVGITTVTTTHRVIYTSLRATTTTRPATNKRWINETQSTETIY